MRSETMPAEIVGVSRSSRDDAEGPNRRTVLQLAAAFGVSGIASGEAAAAGALEFGPAEPFDFETVRVRAKLAADAPFGGGQSPSRAILDQIDYETHGKIKYRPDQALWGAQPDQRRYPVTFFHLGRYFQTPVRVFALENGVAREIIYREELFEMPADSIARQLPRGAGFAGFRFQEAVDGALDWRRNDWVAFLGASYFRAIGELYQYGLSARGVAIDVANPGGPEDFPAFSHIWLEQPRGGDAVVVYALLDGASCTGAFRIAMRRDKAVTMEVDASLNLRRDVARFGVAPVTSMYWFSETTKGGGAQGAALGGSIDWRPEVHDSDGLALWTGSGERIWRPLNNPPRTVASAFLDENPRGFGLLQRDRIFADYMDGVHYERRPSLWIEPLENWGKGSLQLVEIPTDDEIHDNIVAHWVPEKPARAGDSARFRYRLHWAAEEPFPSPLARCVATRLGRGGQPGQPRPAGVRKFMVEFQGAPLADVPFGAKPDAVLWASRGTFSYVFTEAVPDEVAGHWRAQFDLTVEGAEPVEMRLFLRLGEKVLTETWLYQYHPA